MLQLKRLSAWPLRHTLVKVSCYIEQALDKTQATLVSPSQL